MPFGTGGEGAPIGRVARVHVFHAFSSEDLERQINEWLKENPGVAIQFVAQSESNDPAQGSRLTFTILYEPIGS